MIFTRVPSLCVCAYANILDSYIDCASAQLENISMKRNTGGTAKKCIDKNVN